MSRCSFFWHKLQTIVARRSCQGGGFVALVPGSLSWQAVICPREVNHRVFTRDSHTLLAGLVIRLTRSKSTHSTWNNWCMTIFQREQMLSALICWTTVPQSSGTCKCGCCPRKITTLSWFWDIVPCPVCFGKASRRVGCCGCSGLSHCQTLWEPHRD